MDGAEKDPRDELIERTLAALASRGIMQADRKPLAAADLPGAVADMIDGFVRERIEHLTTIDVLVKRLAAKR